MNYVENNISFVDMIKYMDVAVENSFGKNGYHKYLQDYAETLILVSLFTDYSFEGKTAEQMVEESLAIYHSAEWWNDIIPQIKIYEAFHDYVESEIEYRLRPLAGVDDLVKTANGALAKVVEVLSAIDVDALKNYDFSGITAALEAYNNAAETSKTSGDIIDIAQARAEATGDENK